MRQFIVCDKNLSLDQIIDMIQKEDENPLYPRFDSFQDFENARKCYQVVLNRDQFQIVEIEITAKSVYQFIK